MQPPSNAAVHAHHYQALSHIDPEQDANHQDGAAASPSRREAAPNTDSRLAFTEGNDPSGALARGRAESCPLGLINEGVRTRNYEKVCAGVAKARDNNTQFPLDIIVVLERWFRNNPPKLDSPLRVLPSQAQQTRFDYHGMQTAGHDLEQGGGPQRGYPPCFTKAK